ncbi:MAG: hypothetical protein ACI8O8_001661 [Oleiphilaceae bacterium]
MLPYFPGYGRLFLCRHCYGLPYASNTEDALNRSASQKYKLGERIFEYYEYGDGWGKKKGMHQRTFNRLYKKYCWLDDVVSYAMIKKFRLENQENSKFW